MGEDPLKVDLWVQMHDLPIGYMSEIVGKQLGNFLGTFIQYDPNNNSSIWREFMRLRVRIDVKKPLKQKKKIVRKDKLEVMCNASTRNLVIYVSSMAYSHIRSGSAKRNWKERMGQLAACTVEKRW